MVSRRRSTANAPRSSNGVDSAGIMPLSGVVIGLKEFLFYRRFFSAFYGECFCRGLNPPRKAISGPRLFLNAAIAEAARRTSPQSTLEFPRRRHSRRKAL